MACAAKGAAANSMKNVGGLRAAAARGQQAAWAAGGTGSGSSAASAPGGSGGDSAPPAWAQKLQGAQAGRHRRQMAIHAIRDGDKGGAGANPDITERD